MFILYLLGTEDQRVHSPISRQIKIFFDCMNPPFLDIKENEKVVMSLKKRVQYGRLMLYQIFLNCQEINFSRQARDAKTLSDCTHAMQLVQQDESIFAWERMKFQNDGGGKRKSPGKVASVYFKIVHNYTGRGGCLKQLLVDFICLLNCRASSLSLIIGFETMYRI